MPKLPVDILDVLKVQSEKTLLRFNPISERKVVSKFLPFYKPLFPLEKSLKMRPMILKRRGRSSKSNKKYWTTEIVDLEPYQLSKITHEKTNFEYLFNHFKRYLNINIQNLFLIQFKDKMNFKLDFDLYIVPLETQMHVNTELLLAGDLQHLNKNNEYMLNNILESNKSQYFLGFWE